MEVTETRPYPGVGVRGATHSLFHIWMGVGGRKEIGRGRGGRFVIY